MQVRSADTPRRSARSNQGRPDCDWPVLICQRPQYLLDGASSLLQVVQLPCPDRIPNRAVTVLTPVLQSVHSDLMLRFFRLPLGRQRGIATLRPPREKSSALKFSVSKISASKIFGLPAITLIHHNHNGCLDCGESHRGRNEGGAG